MNNLNTDVVFQMTIIIPSKILNSSIKQINGTLTGITNLGQSGSEGNSNEVLFHIPKIQRLKPHHQVQLGHPQKSIAYLLAITGRF